MRDPGESFAKAVTDALNRVPDPCSAASGEPIGLVDMGLIESWSMGDNGSLRVRMGVTSPCCTLAGNIANAASEALRALPGVNDVDITFDAERFWTPDMMSSEARGRLDRRARSSGVQPRQYQLQITPK